MYKLLLSPFWLVVFVVWLNLSVLWPTLVCACRTRSTDHQRVQRYAPFHSTDNSATVGIHDSLWMFFSYKKMLGRSETRTRERKYLGRIRSVWDISRGDRARIATCSLQTSTDKFKANYSIDISYVTGRRCIRNGARCSRYESLWFAIYTFIQFRSHFEYIN